MRRLSTKYSLDLVAWSLLTPLAFFLRLEAGVADYLPQLVALTLAGVVLKAIAIGAFQLHRRAWRWAGLSDLLAVGQAVAVVAVIQTSFGLLSHLPFLTAIGLNMPRSVPLIEAALAVIVLGGSRVAVRLFHESRGRRDTEDGARRVLLVGAGDAGMLVARELMRHPESGMRPVGFLDDDPVKRRQRYVGLPVLGGIDDLTLVAKVREIDEVLITMPSQTGDVIRRIVVAAHEAGCRHRILPSFRDLVSGEVTLAELREIDLDDLLHRDPVRLDPRPIEAVLQGRTILVTGAGGSIGSEIVRQVAPFRPARIVLLGRGENSVFTIDGELRRLHPELERHAIICDVRDEPSLHAVFEEFRPDVVFHAAAHKHVPLMERNPDQAVWNNVVGTRNLVELCLAYGVERLVNVSTDKAVNPTNVMGASKRVSELVVADGARRCAEGSTMVSVRFGNVLGSRGSVVPYFRDQIRRGGPVTVTHPDMVRYFMTIPEAAQLVLQAGTIAENGRVYVLDMGKPVRIVDLARDLIILSGLEPGRDIQIAFSGARPGEKLFEELLTAEEGTEPSPHKKIFVARKKDLGGDLSALLDDLMDAARSHDPAAIRAAFQALVPTFAPDAAAPTGSGRDDPAGDGTSSEGKVPELLIRAEPREVRREV
jgi:FlaA1/EpsC-like NDP-sugar epimerase